MKDVGESPAYMAFEKGHVEVELGGGKQLLGTLFISTPQQLADLFGIEAARVPGK